mmetsp:Transcript_95/g.329  ORF Transcript_95/g.329 Transcript_95/m.329 type:complete len:208 (-) Transcript_95:48-671(-)
MHFEEEWGRLRGYPTRTLWLLVCPCTKVTPADGAPAAHLKRGGGESCHRQGGPRREREEGGHGEWRTETTAHEGAHRLLAFHSRAVPVLNLWTRRAAESRDVRLSRLTVSVSVQHSATLALALDLLYINTVASSSHECLLAYPSALACSPALLTFPAGCLSSTPPSPQHRPLAGVLVGARVWVCCWRSVFRPLFPLLCFLGCCRRRI